MNKKQYMKVIEQIINSPRSDLQKIGRLQNAFELYNKEIIDKLEQLEEDCKYETNYELIDMCVNIVKGDTNEV